jgi:Glyoxalase/Bleomycin resistance protein/Dioxygenase superfamily
MGQGTYTAHFVNLASMRWATGSPAGRGQAASSAITQCRGLRSASLDRNNVVQDDTRLKEMPMSQTISIERVDHIGIRVRDLDRALSFYRALGFRLLHRSDNDDALAFDRCDNRSVVFKEPTAFNSIQEPSVLSWIPPLPRRNYAL